MAIILKQFRAPNHGDPSTLSSIGRSIKAQPPSAVPRGTDTLLKQRVTARLLVICLIASAVFSVQLARGEIGPIGQPQLDSALLIADEEGKSDVLLDNRRLPLGSWLAREDTVGIPPDFGVVLFEIFTPWARATRFAAMAQNGRAVLDSNLWRPEMFSSGVHLIARGVDVSVNIVRVEQVIFAVEGRIIEPIWTQVDSVAVDLGGEQSIATSVQAIFPLEPFNAGKDLDFYIVTNLGQREFSFSAEEISKLR